MATNHNPHRDSGGEYPPPAGDFAAYPTPGRESADLGYETTDVNTGGIVVFLGGLLGFVLIFFVFCFFMGKVINEALNKQDGPNDRWHRSGQIFAGAKNNGGKLDSLVSSSRMDQQEFASMTREFPQPRLDTDDGNQATANLHAREDLLLDHYSSVPGQPLRIPIDRAMQLIAQRGLPVAPAPTANGPAAVANEKTPGVTAPLTSGFARTGYELDTIEAREQRLMYGKAVQSNHAQLQPLK